MFFVEATADKYLEAITLLKHSLFNVEFTEERAKTVISQLLNSIPSEKLSASKIVNTLSDSIFFSNKSSIHHASFLRQQKYLTSALEELKVNPGRLIGKFHQIRQSILRPGIHDINQIKSKRKCFFHLKSP
jgi:Zn-dependent M16 (insulinase) family peptidase